MAAVGSVGDALRRRARWRHRRDPLLQDDGTSLRAAASSGLAADIREDSVPLGRGIIGRIANTWDGLVANDLAGDAVLSQFLKSPVRSTVGVPLRIGDRLIGIMHVGSCSPRRFTEDDLVLLRLVADRAALAIERTRLIDNALEARATAEAANRAKDEFLAVVGHEFRNPLSAITHGVDLLDRIGKREDTAMHTREMVRRQARHLGRLVDDLLEMNRIMAGKVSLAREAIDLAVAVRRCAATLSAAGKLEHHIVKLDLERVWIDADPVRIDEVILNLLDNAVKYTPAGGAVVVTAGRVDGDAVLQVCDSGIGIPPSLVPHVFEPFVQGEPGSRSARGGLGIGLSVVRRLVEMQSGWVEASSPGRDRGSTFTVRLPSVPGPCPAPNSAV